MEHHADVVRTGACDATSFFVDDLLRASEEWFLKPVEDGSAEGAALEDAAQDQKAKEDLPSAEMYAELRKYMPETVLKKPFGHPMAERTANSH